VSGRELEKQFKVFLRYYKDDNHGSVPFISEYEGLRFLLDFYNPGSIYKIQDPSYNVDSFIVAISIGQIEYGI